MRITLLLVALVSLAACAVAPAVWNRPDATAALVTADLAECRRLALDEMWRLGWERNWPPRFYDPRFMPPYYRGLRPFWFDFSSSLERESALTDFCMHSKGYRLEALPR
jgi:hypothetical protein